mgnify:CR=1 FL=1|tara:strand:+ start:1060 stop:1335 length:276 start_codon:yes stop_codon:yes gene_type:complete
MEIIKNRNNQERVIEKISTDKLRIMGESLFSRISSNDSDIITMYDFEGGPCLNVGGAIYYKKSNWIINKISPEKTNQPNFESVLLEVKLSN